MNSKPKAKGVRHCMVVHNYYPYAETRVQRQAQALVNAGHQVDVICLRHGNEPKIDNVSGVLVHRVPLSHHKKGGVWVQLFDYLAFFVLAFFQLGRLHAVHRYHVVQVHNLPDFLVFAALIPKLMGSRIILDLHDLMPEFYSAKFASPMSSLPVRLIRWQEQISCRFANHVITVTEPWRQTLIERGVPADKCSVVMNVADPQYFYLDGATQPAQDKHFRLVYHGTMARRYGIDLILRAVDQVRKELPQIRLAMHGRGDYLEAVQALAKELDLSEWVQISSDFLPLEDLTDLIRSAHIGIVPYRRDVFTDGILPTKLMEYAALGIPAIVARTPGIEAYFDDSMVAFFHAEDVNELADCIATLCRDRARLKELTQNVQRFNQQYNWAAQQAEYANLVEQLAAH